MFTGIIEEVGTVKSIQSGKSSSVLRIKGQKVVQGTRIGDSIATNGICLTVTKIENDSFEADVMSESLKRTNIGTLIPGSFVNLERALSLETRLGGHIVSGHIDGTGQISEFKRDDNAVWLTIETDPGILRYIIEKGSIAIDGVSLTVAAVDDQSFQVSIIPHTGEETVLLCKQPGDTVNLECDMIGKYVEKLLGLNSKKQPQESSRITQDYLQENGFF
ncbi:MULTISPECIES: riboflavin synthase [Carnobacterium]|uniref:Riboflavin synthase n=1 Tax=Carnobacterium antarcticum TaxID=2126436 RepID=A0ABW4NPC2_9LACT|nr:MULTISPECIES: riboflavin synthase [unclassified Carnobacterium]ALV22823.1 Riboflavin synthase /eukaryotic [Carnobacterium sp. CP1]QQP70713.1 riboflavin synthase [Carnobacterium sp. CS13]